MISASLDKVYLISEEVVAREVGGEFVIIPVTSGVGDLEDEIFSLNESGRAIWDKLDGKKDLKAISEELTGDFDGSLGDIEKDALGLVEELLKRRMLVEKK